MPYTILECYENYRPPVPVESAVRDVLRCAPQDYLEGLGAVILTNTTAASLRKESAHRYKVVDLPYLADERMVGAVYEPAKGDNAAAIVVYVDTLLVQGTGLKTNRLASSLVNPMSLRMRFGLCLGEALEFHVATHEGLRPIDPEQRQLRSVIISRIWRRRWYLLVLAALSFACMPRLLCTILSNVANARREDREHKGRVR